ERTAAARETAASTAAPAAASAPGRPTAPAAPAGIRQGIQAPEHDPRADAAVAVAVPPPYAAAEVRQDDEADHHQPENPRKWIAAGMLALLLGLLGGGEILL